jgi:hypothetical protein
MVSRSTISHTVCLGKISKATCPNLSSTYNTFNRAH